jgi:hypothetical protein
MQIKLTITGISLATIITLASPAYAGHLGGSLGGGLGGGFGSGLGGFGSGGAIASQGGLNGSLKSGDTESLRHAANKVDTKTGTAAQAAGGAEGKTNAGVGKVAADAGSSVQGEATKTPAQATAKSPAAAAPAKSATTNSTPASGSSPAAAAPAKSATANSTPASGSPSKPGASTTLTGAGDAALNSKNGEVSGSGMGSIGAEHSPGSNSAAAAGTASGAVSGSASGTASRTASGSASGTASGSLN